MSHHAVWRKGTNDPTTARQWLLRWRGSAAPAKMGLDKVARIGVIVLIVLVVGGAIGRTIPQVVGPIAIVGVGVADIVSRRIKRKKPWEEKEPPGPGTAFEIGITIQNSHGIKTGADRGWLIFSDGWILFEGARTDFAVTRGESFRRPRESSLVMRLEDGRSVVLYALGNAPLPKRLNRAFSAWEATPIPDGESLLPPREIHPEVWAERHSLWMAGSTVAAITFAFGLIVASWPTIALALLAFGIFLAGSSECSRRLRESMPKAFASNASPLPSSEAS